MTVELAFLIPVVIVSALIIINLGYFSSLCAKFDRVSQDMITSHGVAPSGEQSSASAKAQIEEKLKQAMGRPFKWRFPLRIWTLRKQTPFSRSIPPGLE